MARICSGGREPYSKFRCWLGEKKITFEDVGKVIGRNKSGISQRINGTGADFTADEVRTICLHYGISSDEFFVAKKVSQ